MKFDFGSPLKAIVYTSWTSGNKKNCSESKKRVSCHLISVSWFSVALILATRLFCKLLQIKLVINHQFEKTSAYGKKPNNPLQWEVSTDLF